MAKQKSITDRIEALGTHEMKGGAWVYLAIIVAVVVFIIVAQQNDFWFKSFKSGGAGRSNSATASGGGTHDAWAYMQLFVKERLKSPTSADFPFGGHREVKPLGGGRYSVTSYVDAENALGVDMRQHFTCTVRRGDGQWILESLEFQQ